MKSYLLLLAFYGEVTAEKLFQCGDGPPCAITQCCIGEGTCGVCPAHEYPTLGVTHYTSERGFPENNPRHIASPPDAYAGNTRAQLDAFNKWGGETGKDDLEKWKDWTDAAINNKGLHWDVIMGTMYTKHIEKEQKTLERLSNDVKSQLNSMYLGKGPGCKGRFHHCATTPLDRCARSGCEVEPASLSATHAQSPIQISMKDTKNAYTALVDCLKASVSSNDYPTYLDLVQRRGSNRYEGPVAGKDVASFGEDNDLNVAGDNGTTDYLLLLKTRQAHYNLQSSYECSNEEMNFEVRLYKMSKLENRYKLLYLYCKCDLTTQIKKFKKMVQTLCHGLRDDMSVQESGHCYAKSGTTQKRGLLDQTTSADHKYFLSTIVQSECDIDEAFCPEHVFYYTAEGVDTPKHPQAPCSTCVDLGGEHSKITQNPNKAEDNNHRFSGVKWTGTIRRNFNEF